MTNKNDPKPASVHLSAIWNQARREERRNEMYHRATLWIIAVLLALSILTCVGRVRQARGEDFAVCPQDAAFFGVSREVSEQCWRKSLAHKAAVLDCQAWWDAAGGQPPWAEIHEDAVWRWRCWDALDDAIRCTSPDSRRCGMVRLRAALGDDDYYLGRMPEPIAKGWE